jgi:hypothetical protein
MKEGFRLLLLEDRLEARGTRVRHLSIHTSAPRSGSRRLVSIGRQLCPGECHGNRGPRRRLVAGQYHKRKGTGHLDVDPDMLDQVEQPRWRHRCRNFACDWPRRFKRRTVHRLAFWQRPSSNNVARGLHSQLGIFVAESVSPEREPGMGRQERGGPQYPREFAGHHVECSSHGDHPRVFPGSIHGSSETVRGDRDYSRGNSDFCQSVPGPCFVHVPCGSRWKFERVDGGFSANTDSRRMPATHGEHRPEPQRTHFCKNSSVFSGSFSNSWGLERCYTNGAEYVVQNDAVYVSVRCLRHGSGWWFRCGADSQLSSSVEHIRDSKSRVQASAAIFSVTKHRNAFREFLLSRRAGSRFCNAGAGLDTTSFCTSHGSDHCSERCSCFSFDFDCAGFRHPRGSSRFGNPRPGRSFFVRGSSHSHGSSRFGDPRLSGGPLVRQIDRVDFDPDTFVQDDHCTKSSGLVPWCASEVVRGRGRCIRLLSNTRSRSRRNERDELVIDSPLGGFGSKRRAEGESTEVC